MQVRPHTLKMTLFDSDLCVSFRYGWFPSLVLYLKDSPSLCELGCFRFPSMQLYLELFFLHIQNQSSSGKINLSNVNRVNIRGLHFIGCGNKRFAGVNHLTIYNTTYQHWNGTGTLLHVVETNASIIRSSFMSNRISDYQGPFKIPEALNSE